MQGTKYFRRAALLKARGWVLRAVGAQERPRENQVIGLPGGPYVLPDKSPLFSGSRFAVYFDAMIIIHLYGSLPSGDSRSAPRVMWGGVCHCSVVTAAV